MDNDSSENKSQNYNPELLKDLLPIYYKRLFPHIQFYRWLSYGHSEASIFTNREISFTLEDDIYIRYLSFEDQTELQKEICNRIPFKIDIGAIFNARPKNHRAVRLLKPIQRELVFDIDMTDYDDVRTCCDEANVCQKCWKYMTIAFKILDAALREDFGFEHILWVFSGRRGVHCWICDATARHLTVKGRQAIAEYLQIMQVGGENAAPKISINTNDKIHHSIKRALSIIEPVFEEICIKDQNLFGTSDGIKKMVRLINDENMRKDCEQYLKSYEGNSKNVWDAFVRYINSQRVQNSLNRKLKYIIEEIQLLYCYPRLDINVTKGINHLLKAPFCIHPKTGKICLPFNSNIINKFNPDKVPTINLLLDEINAFDDKNKIDDLQSDEKMSRIKDYKKTSMFNGVLIFEEFLRKLEDSFKQKAIEISDTRMEL